METETQKPKLAAVPTPPTEVSPTIKLTYGDIRNPNFTTVFQRLVDSQLPYQVQRNITALGKLINNERMDCQTKINEIFAKYGEDFTPPDAPAGSQPMKRITKENESEANDKLKELMEVEFETGFKRFSPVILTAFDLSASELLSLAPMFTEELLASPAPTTSASPSPSTVQ